MPGGGSDASVAAARRQPLSGDGEGTSEPRHQLRAGAGDDLAKVDEQIDAMLTALTRVTLHLTSLRPLGDAEDSVPTEREKMILVAMKQMDWKLEQLRKDRDKLAGAQSDHGPSSAASSTAPSAAPPTTPSTVEELFHMNGLDLLSMPTPAWDNIFKTKPKKRLVDFDDKAALCQCLAHLHIWFKKQLDEDSGDAETVGKQSEEPPAEGECPDENQAEDQKSDSSKDSRSMRLCLFYLASFPGSGKTHLCRQLAEVLDKLRSDDKRTSDELLGAAQRGAALPRPAMCAEELLLTPQTVEWAKKVQLIGVNFNSERWNLNSTDRELARDYGKFIPLYLRILFFAVADVSNADAAEAAWLQLGTSSVAALKAGPLTEAAFEAAVLDLFRRRCGSSAPHRPFILVVDELAKARSFCPDVYAVDEVHPDAPSSFRSQCCALANKVNGHVLVSSLDEALPAAETVASGRHAQEVVLLPPFPTRKLVVRALRRLSRKGLCLNDGGQLVQVGEGSDSRDFIEPFASTLSALVGSDARFAIHLSDALEAAVAGSTLSAAVTTAASEDVVTCAGVWDHPAADIIVAHAIRGAEVLSVSTLAELVPRDVAVVRPAAEHTWDEVRLKGLIQAVGGPTFVVKMPLYVVWTLDESAARAQPLRQALLTMVDRSGDTTLLKWQTWEALWNNLEIALAQARWLVSRSDLESLSVMYPCTSFVGGSLSFILADTKFLPTGVATLLLPSLLQSFFSDDLSLTKLVWRMPHNAVAIDAVRFVADQAGKLRVLCYQTKMSDVDKALSWNGACELVKSMCVWLAVAAWTATCRPPDVPASPVTKEQQQVKNLWTEMCDAADGEQKVGVEGGWWNDAGPRLSDPAAVDAFVKAEWSRFPPSSSSPEDVALAVSTVLSRAVFVVAVCRPRGKRFLADSRDAPSYMRRAIVVTSEDLPGHAGDFLSTIVGDCGRTPSTSFSVQPEASSTD